MKEGGWGKGRRKREKEGQRIGRLSGIRHSERQQGEKQSKIGGGRRGGGRLDRERPVTVGCPDHATPEQTRDPT